MTNEELTNRLFEVDEVVASHTEKIHTLFTQISDLRKVTESIYELTTSVKTLAIEQHTTQSKLDDLVGDVSELKSRPAKRWDGVVKVAMTAVITALITYLLSRIGLA